MDIQGLIKTDFYWKRIEKCMNGFSFKQAFYRKPGIDRTNSFSSLNYSRISMRVFYKSQMKSAQHSKDLDTFLVGSEKLRSIVNIFRFS